MKFTCNLSPEDHGRLERLAKMSGSKIAVFRKALKVMEAITEPGTDLVKRKNGSEEVVKFFF